jgi:hypothetical protein
MSTDVEEVGIKKEIAIVIMDIYDIIKTSYKLV